MAELAAEVPELVHQVSETKAALSQAEVIRRHVLRNPERFSPDERENVFGHTQGLGEKVVRLEVLLQASTGRLELLGLIEPHLALAGEPSLDEVSGPADSVQQAIESERRRIAKELHEGPAQLLSDLVLEADILQRLLRRDPSLVEPELEDFKASVRTAVADMRRIMFDLAPVPQQGI
jgi:two-component system sensor histidine kinase DegS